MPGVFMCASGVSTMVRARASKAAVLGWAVHQTAVSVLAWQQRVTRVARGVNVV